MKVKVVGGREWDALSGTLRKEQHLIRDDIIYRDEQTGSQVESSSNHLNHTYIKFCNVSNLPFEQNSFARLLPPDSAAKIEKTIAKRPPIYSSPPYVPFGPGVFADKATERKCLQ